MVHTKVLQTENSRTFLTVCERLDNEPRKFNQFLASGLATLSALCVGMCLVWTSPALPMLEQSEAHVKITKNQGAWIGSLLTLGACLGAVPAGSIANWIGRKRTLLALAVPFFTSWLIIAYGDCVYALYAARFLAGLAIGGVSVAAPMYVAELAHSSIRGTLGTFFQVLITVGVLLEYILGGTISSFYILALVSAAFPLIFLVTFAFMPETPIHLYTKGRIEDARKSLQFFRGRHYNVDEELLKIADEVKQASANKTKCVDLFRSKATLNGLVIAVGLMLFQQLSGINAVLFYAGNIFQETGSSMPPDTCAIVVGIVQVIATLLSTLLIDKTGRKILLFLSAFIMSISLIILGAYFHVKQSRDLTSLNFLPLASLALFIIMFSVGFGPIPWIMLGEVFTPQSKGVASSIAAAVSWILGFTVTNQYQNMNDALGTGLTFVVFGCVCGVGALFVGMVVPETKGKNVEEVQELLGGNPILNYSSERSTTTEI